MATELSKAEARRLALQGQGLARRERSALGGTQAAIERLGYVQIDAISVIMRAHHHSLWNRVQGYQPRHLAQLMAERQVFEYWSHAAAFLPMRDYRFSLPHKQAIQSGQYKHWYSKDPVVMREVLARIRAEGPLCAQDFADPDARRGTWWEWKPAKKALEQLFMQGDLMCAERRGFHKVYDLPERVLPAQIDQTMPSREAFLDYLIDRGLRAHGLLNAEQLAYLRRGTKADMQKRLRERQEAGDIIALEVAQQTYFSTPSALEQLAAERAPSSLRLLSPFDNLVIQRKRLAQLFDFDYQIECYVPAPKRQYGYFVLPVLWRDAVVARIELKAHRSEQQLQVVNWYAPDLPPKQAARFYPALARELQRFAEAHHCGKITEAPPPLRQALMALES